MSVKTKVINELKSVFWVSLYFLCWFGTLMLLKVLLLDEFGIDFSGVSIVIISSLVVTKVVIILENIPLFKNNKQKAWVEVLSRTFLYSIGVFIIMALEKSIEARHDFGGVFKAFKHLAMDANNNHIWVDTICVFGALLFFNVSSVLKRHLGEGGFLKILQSPIPTNNTD